MLKRIFSQTFPSFTGLASRQILRFENDTPPQHTLLFSIAYLTFLILTLPNAGYAQTQQATNIQGAVALAGRLVGDDKSMRLLIDFDRPVKIDLRYMADPKRIIINLPRTAFKFKEGEEPKELGMVTRLQFGTISRQTSRIVMQLASPAKVIKSEIKPADGNKIQRLILDFEAIGAEEYATIAREQAKYSGASGDVATKGNRVRKPKADAKKFTIVLDPGHGGIDGGATGKNRSIEKNITFDVAMLIRDELKKNKDFNVLLTREDDVFVSLKQRVEFGRRAHADLFISIHADSLSQRFVRGATVYTLSKKASDNLSDKLAQAENLSDLVAGLAIDTTDDAVTDILVELTARETVRFSKFFSNILATTLAPGINLINNPQRSAAFGVLKAPEVPSVLLELGYLSNVEDEKQMNSAAWKQKLSKLVSDAVKRFFELRGG